MLKNLSNRVSAKTIEETYTENDVTNSYQPDIGYQFDYPQRWLNDESDFKAIGIRRLHMVPTSHVFTININIVYQKQGEDSPLEKNYLETLEIIAENNFEEIIHKLVIDFRQSIIDYRAVDNSFPDIQMTYNYDYRTGNFELKLKDNSSESEKLDALVFAITGESDDDLQSFIEFLNQENTTEVHDKLEELSEKKVFTNVWDRSTLQFHASFSDNRRGFVGLNEDFYENPSVFYDPPSNMFNFWIKFTTDGIHQILPRYSRFYIGLCFVRNYKNSLVTT